MANRFKKAAEARKEGSSIESNIQAEVINPEPIVKIESKIEAPAPAAAISVQPSFNNKAMAQKDETIVGISMKIPATVRDALRMRHAKTGETTTSYIKRLIEEDMRNNPF